ncbi:ADP-forming succinate--CoA ligase subunit beta [uncultured Bacteroides sp.]|uniref:ADP-forming succinate--CoA ligase subunit beta n=1 Tax=uncultured Bacteroides sp. TaxID=162156 RepID=UPI0025D10E5E|nr:ADP-forming succinate--CoA ligase subunit beta [uncultured Bacteroides sp.]
MKIHEYQAKKLFAAYGIPVEKHLLCETPAEIRTAFKKLGNKTAVVKAQVLTGGRGKAGGVKLVHNEEEAFKQANAILNMEIKGLQVKKVLLSEAVDIKSEYYVSFTIDRNTRSVILMLSASGGMDIEEVARLNPEKIQRFIIDPFIGLPDFLARQYAFTLFKEIENVNSMAVILQSLYRLFVEKDVSLAEINPLVLTNNGTLVAIDGKLVFDDNALYRHPDISALNEPTEEERTEAYARSCGFSYVRMDGSIGCMVNGAGLAMATMDLIKLYGASPANFLDIGGSSNPRKVTDAMQLLLADPKVCVVLINIFGGITRCDDVAQGLIQAVEMLKPSIPIVVRLTGTNEQEGRALLAGKQFFIAQSLEEAAQKAVSLFNELP